MTRAGLCGWITAILSTCLCAAVGAATILDLQPSERVTTARITSSTGQRGTATLIDLKPNVNAWYLLGLRWNGSSVERWFHLENPQPRRRKLVLSGDAARYVALEGDESGPCDLWWRSDALAVAAATAVPYAPLCDGRLYLRNRVTGSYTQLERTTNFLRDHVWGGDRIVRFVKERFFRDAYMERGESDRSSEAALLLRNAPRSAAIDAAADLATVPQSLALDVDAQPAMRLGSWYAIRGVADVFVSVVKPQVVAPTIFESDLAHVNRLDVIESAALDYLVAFDLAAFEIGFALGTDHPRLDWSTRPPASVRNSQLPGPDGIDNAEPLVRTGMIDPALVPQLAATFVGGFKREHGAFRYGELAVRNGGSHYGFIEQGVVFSRLRPGLATLVVDNDGAVDLLTWSDADDSRLPHIRHARQNGVPLLETNATGTHAGSLVNQWGAGNWSGSEDKQLRTLRAGVCLLESYGRRYLVYGYFSTATPSAMVRVFQAYGCRYAMHLDMNALEHTYLALYTRAAGTVTVQHLIEGMSVLDRTVRGAPALRFIAVPDNRDFLYVVRKGEGR